MNAMPFVIGALAVLALAYRFYYSFICAKVLMLNDNIEAPSIRLFDKHNYYPMNKWVVFGHHFAAIAGAGPLVGPVLAAQFGFMPGFIWMVIGAVMAGAVHDLIILTASVRHDGKSLAEIAKAEISTFSGSITSIAVLIILVIALAGLGVVRGAMGVVAADIPAVVAAHALVTHPDVRLHVLDHVADVGRAVRIGQGAGDEDGAAFSLGHGTWAAGQDAGLCHAAAQPISFSCSKRCLLIDFS